MPVNDALRTTNTTNSGIVIVVFRDPDTPADTSAIIERSETSGALNAPSGNWVEIGEIPNCDTAGSHFIDYLPFTETRYWYRAKHVSLGYTDSEYVFETSGTATEIPDVDWTKKPWLLSTIPLQLDMVVVSQSVSSWEVSASVNQPIFGGAGVRPSITLFASGNVGLIASSSVSGNWTINRPTGSAAGQPSFVTFQNYLQGYLPGRDRVQLFPTTGSQITSASFLRIETNVIRDEATASLVAVTGSDPESLPVWLGVSGSSNVPFVTVAQAQSGGSGSWWVGRPVGNNNGYVDFIVTSSNLTKIWDTDRTTIVRQDFGVDDFLKLSINVTSSTATTLGVSCSAENLGAVPLGYGFSNVFGGLSVVRDGVSQFTITRPSSGVGSVVFAVTSSDADTIADTDTFYVSSDATNDTLKVALTVTGYTNSSITVSASVLPGGLSPTLSASIHPGGRFTFTGTNPYTITRPLYGTGNGDFKVFATATGKVPDSDTISVPERVDGIARLKMDTFVTAVSDITVTVSASVSDPLGIVTPTLSASLVPGGSDVNGQPFKFTGTNPWTVYRPLPSSAAPTNDLDSIEFRIVATAPERVADFDTVQIPRIQRRVKRPWRVERIEQYVEPTGRYVVLLGGRYWESNTDLNGSLWSGSNAFSGPFVATIVEGQTAQLNYGTWNAASGAYAFTFTPGTSNTYTSSVVFQMDMRAYTPAHQIISGTITDGFTSQNQFIVTFPPQYQFAPSLANQNSGSVNITGGTGNFTTLTVNGTPVSTGSSGATGPTGPTGPQGPIGVTGATGIGVTGATGIQGPQGIQGVTGPIGVTGATGPGFTWRGTWTTFTSYAIRDVVFQGGNAYQCISAHTSTGTFPGVGAQWQLMVQQGATGVQGVTGVTGPQGIQGATGVQGVTGPAGVTGATGIQGPVGPTGTADVTISTAAPSGAPSRVGQLWARY